MTAKSVNFSSQQYRQVLALHSMGYRVKLLSQLLDRNFQEQLQPLV